VSIVPPPKSTRHGVHGVISSAVINLAINSVKQLDHNIVLPVEKVADIQKMLKFMKDDDKAYYASINIHE